MSCSVKLLKLIGFILIIICTSTEAATEFKTKKTLQMVIALFRHGERSPINTYPTDPNKDYPWIGGFIALQPRGIEQMYRLGQTLRDRYGFLLPKHGMYTNNTAFVLSSASERCILTAQSLMASFYKPPADKIDIPIQWQPVPVNVLKSEDDILLGQRRPCPKLDKTRQKLFTQPPPEWKQWVQDATSLKEFVSAKIGSDLASFGHLMVVCDAIEIQYLNGLKLPDWANEIFPEKINAFIRGMERSYSATDDLKRIRGGAILDEFLDKMKSKQNGSLSPNRQLFFYSAHDVTQSNLFNTMGLEPAWISRPDFGATTIFELHSSLGSDMEVRMLFYPNTTTTRPISLDIPNCGKPCSLTNFEQSIKNMLLDDYDKECSIESSKNDN